jgi:hypothetical protein
VLSAHPCASSHRNAPALTETAVTPRGREDGRTRQALPEDVWPAYYWLRLHYGHDGDAVGHAGRKTHLSVAAPALEAGSVTLTRYLPGLKTGKTNEEPCRSGVLPLITILGACGRPMKAQECDADAVWSQLRTGWGMLYGYASGAKNRLERHLKTAGSTRERNRLRSSKNQRRTRHTLWTDGWVP